MSTFRHIYNYIIIVTSSSALMPFYYLDKESYSNLGFRKRKKNHFQHMSLDNLYLWMKCSFKFEDEDEKCPFFSLNS